MSTYSNSLVIFILAVALLLENDAHQCGCPHNKTKKECEEKTITTTPTPTTITMCEPCNNVSKPFCVCVYYDNDPLYSENKYPVPKSGNCDDVIKNNYSLTAIPYSKCKKMRQTCRVFCECEESADLTLMPTPTSTKTPTPSKRRTPTPAKTPTPTLTPALCNTGICNNVSEPYCSCGIDRQRYELPENSNCSDIVRKLTTPVYFYRFGFHCTKVRFVCKTRCFCSRDYVVDLPATPTLKPMRTITNHL